MQAHFVTDERALSRSTDRLVKELLMQLGHGSWSARELTRGQLTPGPKRVRSTVWKDIKSVSRTPSRDSWCVCSASAERQF